MSANLAYETVLSELSEDGVRTVALNRPGRLNAMNRQLIDDVGRAFDDANADEERGPSCSPAPAGRSVPATTARSTSTRPVRPRRELVDAIQRATEAIVFGDKPVVGAINGWAVGGGFEWAINCDFPIWGRAPGGSSPRCRSASS